MPLVVASLCFFEVVGIAPRDLDAACFAGCVAGLREVGWAGDECLVGLGFTAAASLRYTVGAVQLVLPLMIDPSLHPAVEDLLGHPFAEVLAGWNELCPFQFGLAEEARALLSMVS